MSLTYTPPLAEPFVNRERIRAEMRSWLDQCWAAGRQCRMYVHGLEGWGVSSLAWQFAKDNRVLFGMEPVWLVGRQPDGTAVPFGELLRQLLRHIKVAERDQDSGEAAQVAQLGRHLRDKALVIVLDDLVNPAQIFNLLPADAPKVVVVATGRFENRTLRSEGFASHAPERLPEPEARALFDSALRDPLDPDLVAELVLLCGGIPLLLKVLAAQIDGRPRIATRLLASLRESPLRLLGLDDEQRMSRFLDVTYAHLPPVEQEVYRRLGLLPTADFRLDMAAAALGRSVDATADVVEKLVDHNLLTYLRDDRYGFHEVVRGDAAARSGVYDSTEERDAVVAGALTWAVEETLPRGKALSGRWYISSLEIPDVAYERDSNIRWFAAETPTLVACVRYARKHGLHDIAWKTTMGLYKYLHQTRQNAALLTTHEEAIESASAVGNNEALMQLNLQKGAAHLDVGEYPAATACFQTALDLADTHPLAAQSALEWMGKTFARQGSHTLAREYYNRSWAAVMARPDVSPFQKDRVKALLDLQDGRAQVAMEGWEGATANALAARHFFDQYPNETDNQAKIRLVLAQALVGQGRATEALPELRTAVELFEKDESWRSLAEARVLYADVLLAAGEDPADQLRAALAYYEEVGSSLADAVRARLT